MTNPIVIGLDPSLTSIGLAYGEGPLVRPQSLKPKKLRGAERMAWIRSQLQAVLTVVERDESLDHVTVIMEGPAFASETSMAYEMGGAGWVMRMVWHDNRVPWFEVPPSTLKMFVTGKGNARKPEMVSELAKRSGLTLATDDEADALALYCVGREMLGLSHALGKLPLTHLRAMAKVVPGV